MDTIAKTMQLAKIILFGSYATNKVTENSAIDLLIIKDSNLPRYQRARNIKKALRGLKVPLDLLVYTPKEIKKWGLAKTAFITQIMAQGKLLYDRQNQSC